MKYMKNSEKEICIEEYMKTHRIGDGVKVTDVTENEDGTPCAITKPGPSLSQTRQTFR